MSRVPDDAARAIVRDSLIRNYFTNSDYLASEEGQRDLITHLTLRLENNRERVIPWLESFLSLRGARVLEIGCGTGASTLALVERGAHVTAVDILASSIQVAADRCRAFGHNAHFLVANAADLNCVVPNQAFDIVIFYAALEHMTLEERRSALRDTWAMLAPGSHWLIIETPNRLWYFDAHTSLLPFFNWLPDALAFEYSRFSSRNYFREMYRVRSPENELHFLRRGRGVSFHEFELFIAPRQDLDIVSCLHTYFRELNPAEKQPWIDSRASTYEEMLHTACPDLHPAFLTQNLDFAIRKH